MGTRMRGARSVRSSNISVLWHESCSFPLARLKMLNLDLSLSLNMRRREMTLSSYRIYLLRSDGHVAHVVRLHGLTRDEALKIAEDYAVSHPVELWRHHLLVRKIRRPHSGQSWRGLRTDEDRNGARLSGRGPPLLEGSTSAAVLRLPKTLPLD